MTNRESVVSFLQNVKSARCDDCISSETKITPRQIVNQICSNLVKKGLIYRAKGTCERCHKNKLVNSVSAKQIKQPELALPKTQQQQGKDSTKGKSAQITGNIGLYYTCYKLSRLGWNVMPTARNAKGIDIVAYKSDCSGYIGIQVKTLSKRAPVPLGTSLKNIMGDYWVIVNNVIKEPSVYILLPEEVRESAHRGVSKKGKVSYWLQPRSYETDEYREAWDRIGSGSK